jgi:holliday junction DNA helicase RuvA
MLTYIEGILAEKSPAQAIIDCHGLGYQLNISLNTYSRLPEIGQKCKLFTHLAVKSEATTPVGMVLYGFHSNDEKNVFLHLISVNGVGMNTGRLILSSLSTAEIVTAVGSGDLYTFKKVKGIGEKTAQRILIELKDKLAKETYQDEIFISPNNSLKNEALTALVMLGFNKNAAEKAMERVVKEQGLDISIEDLIKLSLKHL